MNAIEDDLIVDACTLKNFSVVDRLDIQEAYFDGRAHWTEAIAREAGRLGLPPLDWLGPPLSPGDDIAALPLVRLPNTARTASPDTPSRVEIRTVCPALDSAGQMSKPPPAVRRGSKQAARKGALVPNPVVHFEIIGKNPESLRNYFGELFGWQFDTSSPVAEAVSEPDDYGFVDRITTPDGTGIPGGIGGGAGYEGHVIFYVGVPNVEAALAEAERLGGKRRLGPERAPTGLVIGHFTDPEGNLIGVAGAA